MSKAIKKKKNLCIKTILGVVVFVINKPKSNIAVKYTFEWKINYLLGAIGKFLGDSLPLIKSQIDRYNRGPIKFIHNLFFQNTQIGNVTINTEPFPFSPATPVGGDSTFSSPPWAFTIS